MRPLCIAIICIAHIRPLCIRLSQMTGYARKFNESSTMSFIVKHKKLLKNIVKYGKQLKG